jgi:hypothetical protein
MSNDLTVLELLRLLRPQESAPDAPMLVAAALRETSIKLNGTNMEYRLCLLMRAADHIEALSMRQGALLRKNEQLLAGLIKPSFWFDWHDGENSVAHPDDLLDDREDGEIVTSCGGVELAKSYGFRIPGLTDRDRDTTHWFDTMAEAEAESRRMLDEYQAARARADAQETSNAG